MSQFLICESKDLSNYGVRLSEIKSDKKFYDRVVNQYMKDANADHIWAIEKMLDMVDQLEENLRVVDEISRQSELMIFWYGSDFQDLDKIDTRESLMDYLKHNISNSCPEIYLYVDLKHSNLMGERDIWEQRNNMKVDKNVAIPIPLEIWQCTYEYAIIEQYDDMVIIKFKFWDEHQEDVDDKTALLTFAGVWQLKYSRFNKTRYYPNEMDNSSRSCYFYIPNSCWLKEEMDKREKYDPHWMDFDKRKYKHYVFQNCSYYIEIIADNVTLSIEDRLPKENDIWK